ncbi:MAG TPA: hypothetical protein VK957_00810 [Lunatimonas sp.]|nr:hypothetical protein [Lunatimonas sp.]
MNCLAFLFSGFLFFCSPILSAQQLDFSRAIVVSTHEEVGRIGFMADVFRDEIKKRTGILLPIQSASAENGEPVIVLSIRENEGNLPSAYRTGVDVLPMLSEEGYSVHLDESSQMLIILGEDERGLLYGIGRVLRKMEAVPGKLMIPASISHQSSPKYPIRGHQLGYRPKTNSYDAFSVVMFEQYIRELALFGANSIEIVPPRTDDDFTSRHMILPAIEMIGEQSRIADQYDMDVWMWYPNMGSDYDHPDSLKFEMAEREEVFAAVHRLDHLFIPGGDPGELEPDELFAWLATSAEVLHRHHPNAKIWVSPQVFRPTQEWFDRFFYHINMEYEWLGGVVFGPWVKIPLPELRKLVNPEIPIRRYPDITHSLSSQYPIPDWDLAMSMTLGRECINPRPEDQKAIHNALAHLADGSLSYSEGTNDDVNKFVWTDQDWDPNTPVIETLRDYARFFFGSEWVEGIAQGLLAQEENLRGPLLTNMQVPVTLQLWQEMESKADDKLKVNFRFQMGLIRAYFDAYIQRKLAFQTAAEHQARDLMRQSLAEKSKEPLKKALAVLYESISMEAVAQWRERCMELADDLYESIGAQLTIDPHGAASGRGNFIDNLDAVLNDAPWLIDNINAIVVMEPGEIWEDKLEEVINRTNPGPGGFYDNFGHPKSWRRVVFDSSWEEDPGSLYNPRISFGVGLIGVEWVHEVKAVGFEGTSAPQAWMMQVNTLYDTPLKIRYDHLNPDLEYTLKVAYTGRFRSRMRLEVDGGIEVHDFIQTGQQPIYEFDLPKEAYQDGEITFSWTCGEGERGAQVAELWLMVRE